MTKKGVRGMGILIHSDLDRLLWVSDRVGAMFHGGLNVAAWPNTTKKQNGEQNGRLMRGLVTP